MKKILWAVFVGACAFGATRSASAVETSTAAAVEASTATGDVIHYDNNTGIAIIEGNAVVVTSTAVLKADKITVDTRSKQAHLEGHVSVEQASGTIHGSEV